MPQFPSGTGWRAGSPGGVPLVPSSTDPAAGADESRLVRVHPWRSARRAVAAVALAGIACGGGGPVETAAPAAVPPPDASFVHAMDVAGDPAAIDLLTFEGPSSGRSALLHRRSTDGGATWTGPHPVAGPDETFYAMHRGMDPQIAADGERLLALWIRRGDSPWGSGPLAAAASDDGGRNWRPVGAPAPPGPRLGQGYVDLVAEGGGRFAAVWLDARDGVQGLRAAPTQDGGEPRQPVSDGLGPTCECCWNKAVQLEPGNLAVLYRAATPRDMALALWATESAVWRDAGTVGGFAWHVDGCPHVGGGLAVEPASSPPRLLASVWTGQEDDAGVYTLQSADGGEHWSPPQRLGSRGARANDVAASGRQLAVAWSQPEADGSAVFAALAPVDGEPEWSTPLRLSSPAADARQPLLAVVEDGFLVFWTERRGDGEHEGERLALARLPEAGTGSLLGGGQ